MDFEIVSEITSIETIAIGKAIREVVRLRKLYGAGRWRKLKGVATIRLSNGTVRRAELHCTRPTGSDRENTNKSAIWIEP
jgi:hypothetical protein